MRFVLKTVSLLFVAAMASFGEPIKSTEADREAVEVTIYNNNLGLVKESRKIKLSSGEGELHFGDVAAMINPVTVHIGTRKPSSDFTVLEQNYEYDLIDHHKLLEKYVGKNIKLIDRNEYNDRKEIIEGMLVSVNGGEVYRINNEIHLGHPGYKVLPEIPDNLIARPTLTWSYRCKSAGEKTLDVSYLTEGISWNADYVLVTERGERSGDLSSWVSISNNCGATFKNASLKLVAGSVNRVAEPRTMAMGMRKRSEMMAADQAFTQESFFEYHMYDLQRSSTLKDKQTKQISLMDASGVTLRKEYLVTGQSAFFTSRSYTDRYTIPVQVYINFINSKENRLGAPLPAGVVRIYSADQSGKQQFIGEDRIPHTPRDEEVKLKSGEAFDIVAEQKQTDFKELSSRQYESEWSVAIRNKKEENVTVGVLQNLTGTWEITKSNYEFEKVDAFTVRFDIPVAKNKAAELKYRVRVGL